MPEKKPQNAWEQVGRYTSLAFLFLPRPSPATLVGYLLDRWLGTKFLTVVCLLLGIVGGFVQFIRQVLKEGKS